MNIGIFEFYQDDPAFDVSKYLLLIVDSGISNLSDLYSELYNLAHFEGGCPTNPDWLLDCVGELYERTRDVVILHRDLPPLPSDDLITYLRVLAAAIESWGGSEDWRSEHHNKLRVLFPKLAEVKLSHIQI